jgi:hypothetical protein
MTFSRQPVSAGRQGIAGRVTNHGSKEAAWASAGCRGVLAKEARATVRGVVAALAEVGRPRPGTNMELRPTCVQPAPSMSRMRVVCTGRAHGGHRAAPFG